MVPIDEQLAQRALILRRRQAGYGTLPRRGAREGGPAALTTTGELPRVALYSRDFDDVRETVSFVRDRVLAGHGRGAAARAARRLPRGRARWRGACGGSSERAAQVARGPLHRAAAGRLRGRARPAHADVQRDAGAAAPGGRGAQGVHRHRLARAAHADLLARRASWSCSRTRSSTRRPGASSSRRWASRWSGCRSWPWTCSTSRASTPARSSSQREPVDLAELARSVAGEFQPAAGASTATELELRAPGRAGAGAAATVNGWLRSCVSCSTTPFATRPRART